MHVAYELRFMKLVLEYLASEMTEAEILEDFPDLTREDLKACIAYAADRERRFMTTPLST